MDGVWSVDRIVSGIAVLEGPGRERRELPAAKLPAGVREGDCLRFEAAGWRIDAAETERRRAENRALFERLRKQK